MSSKRKINRYLKLKEMSKYNNLETIFKFYIDGQLQELLKNYGFSDIECYSQIRKDANYLQINFWYHNLVVNIEFDDLCFDYIIYLPGISAEQFENNLIESNYDDDFNIVKFIGDFYNILEKDNRLNKS